MTERMITKQMCGELDRSGIGWSAVVNDDGSICSMNLYSECGKLRNCIHVAGISQLELYGVIRKFAATVKQSVE